MGYSASEIIVKYVNRYGKTLSIPRKDGSTLELPVKYFKDFSNDKLLSTSVKYPCLIVKEYPPDYDYSFLSSEEPIIDGFEDSDDDGTLDTAKKYLPEQLMVFFFDFFFFTKDREDYLLIQDWALAYRLNHSYIFDEQVVQATGEKLGYPVEVKTSFYELPRADAVFQANFSHTFKASVQVSAPEEIFLNEVVTINLP